MAGYDPSGRRDPFMPFVPESAGGGDGENLNLPPLQRVSLTELTLIAVIWGELGYTAMVQTPDGKGYSVKRGTQLGINKGIVSEITPNGFVVQERYTDVYGNKQVREYVKRLHKEGVE